MACGSRCAVLAGRIPGYNTPMLGVPSLPAASHRVPWVFSLLAALVACDSGEPGRVVWDDGNVRYVVHGEAEVAPSVIERVAAQMVDLSALFGVPPRKVEYHFYASTDLLDESNACDIHVNPPGVRVVGCAHADRFTVSSSRPVHTHELAHLLVRQRLGRVPWKLNEGIATLLSPDAFDFLDFDRPGSLRAFDPVDWLDPEGRIDGVEDVVAAYRTSVENTRFVLDELGWKGLLGLAQDASALQTKEEIGSLLRKHFGRSLEELEADFAASPRYPSEAHHWVLPSTWIELAPGEAVLVDGRELQLVRFEHSATERSVFTLEGTALVDIVASAGGRMHPTALRQISLDGPTTIAFEGPSGSYFLHVAGWPRVALERVALDAPLSAFPLFVVGPIEGSSPLCVEADRTVELWSSSIGVGTDVFLAGRPTTFEVCRDEDCTTFDGWGDDDKPKTPKFSAPACIAPGSELPSAFDFAGKLLRAAPGSGRFLMYQVHLSDSQ